MSGESGAAALAGLIGLCNTDKFKNFKNKIRLNSMSTVLVINTEGITDPLNFQKVVGDNGTKQ